MPEPTIQSILQNMAAEHRFPYQYLSSQKEINTLYDLMKCKTEEMGSHIEVCDSCGTAVRHFHSCRNPCCPGCQAVENEKWVREQEQYILDCRYHHTVITFPSELNPYFKIAKTEMLEMAFEAVGETIEALYEEKYGVISGFTAMCHTWGQLLKWHAHYHMILPSGGIDIKTGEWKEIDKKYLFPRIDLGKKIREIFLKKMKNRFPRFLLDVKDPSLSENERQIELEKKQDQFDRVIKLLEHKQWICFEKEALDDPLVTYKYLARYSHRIAISNGRIQKYENNMVTFSYKDYSDGDKIKLKTLSDTEFIRLFAQHIPPEGFRRVRHFGFLSPRDKKKRVELIRAKMHMRSPEEKSLDPVEIACELVGKDIRKCSNCGAEIKFNKSAVQEPFENENPPEIIPAYIKLQMRRAKQYKEFVSRCPSGQLISRVFNDAVLGNRFLFPQNSQKQLE